MGCGKGSCCSCCCCCKCCNPCKEEPSSAPKEAPKEIPSINIVQNIINFSIHIAITLSITIPITLYLYLAGNTQPWEDDVDFQTPDASYSIPTSPTGKPTPELLPPPPPPPQKLIVTGIDRNQRRITARYEILANIDNNYAWEFARSDRIQNLVTNQIEPASSFFTRELSKRDIEGFSYILPVGVASCEGGRAEEENRAWQRGVTIYNYLQGVVNSDQYMPNFLLLGQYNDESCASNPNQTWFQRNMIVIGIRVIRYDDGVNVEEALNDMVDRSLFEFLRDPTYSPLGNLGVGKYSKFEFGL